MSYILPRVLIVYVTSPDLFILQSTTSYSSTYISTYHPPILSEITTLFFCVSEVLLFVSLMSSFTISLCSWIHLLDIIFQAHKIYNKCKHKIFFFFRVDQYSIIYMYHRFLIYSCIHHRLFPYLVIMNNAAITWDSKYLQKLVIIFPLCSQQRDRYLGVVGVLFLTFLEISMFPTITMAISISINSVQGLFLSTCLLWPIIFWFPIMAMLTGVRRWYLAMAYVLMRHNVRTLTLIILIQYNILSPSRNNLQEKNIQIRKKRNVPICMTLYADFTKTITNKKLNTCAEYKINI